MSNSHTKLKIVEVKSQHVSLSPLVQVCKQTFTPRIPCVLFLIHEVIMHDIIRTEAITNCEVFAERAYLPDKDYNGIVIHSDTG